MKRGLGPTSRPSRKPVRAKIGGNAVNSGGLTSKATSTARGSVVVRGLFWGFAFALVTTVSATLGATLALLSPLQIGTTTEQSGRSLVDLFRGGFQYGISRPVNVLVMGIDQIPEVDQKSVDQFSGRSDTLLLVRLDPDEQNVNVLSIPRDTQVEVPSIGVVKINQANVIGGPALTSEVASHALSDVPIDRYVRIDTSAFRELVDLLGGVEVFVPQRMFYEDQTQKLKIDLQPGLQTLNGAQAEQFARFRQDQHGDIGRVQRQQILLKAIQKRLINPLMLTKLPQAFSLVQKHLDTNLSIGEMLALAQFGLRLGDPDHLNMVLLPGRFSQPGEYNASYWIMDPNGVERVMRNYFQVSAIDSGLSEDEAAPTLQTLKIAVQNASSNPEAGQWMVRYLADQGFSNVYLDRDWPDPQDQTQVIAQRGDLDAARTLEAALRVGKVRADSTGSLDSDLTIRVGEDWTRIQPAP